MTCNDEGRRKISELKKVFNPYSDQSLIISNATKYGGGGGGIAVMSLAEQARDIFVHEFAHSAARLGDEY